MQDGFKRRGLRGLAWGAAALAVVWGGAWWGVPRLLQDQLQTRGSALLGRDLSVGAVEFSPWSLELTLRDIRLAAAEGDTPQLALDRLYVDASISSLFRLAPVLDAIELDAPRVHLTQAADGSWDFADILARFPAQDESAPADPLCFALYNIVIRDGALQLDDQAAGTLHRLEALQLQLPFVSNLAAHRQVKVAPQLALRLNGSQISSQALTTPFADQRSTQAELQIQAMDLSAYLGYLPKSLPVQLTAGVLDGRLRLGFEQLDQPQVKLAGELSLSQVRAVDAQQQALLEFDRLQVELEDVQPLARKVALKSLLWQAPKVHLQRRADGSLLPPVSSVPVAAPPAEAAAVEAGSPWAITLANWSVEQAQVDWRDAVPAQPAALQLSELQISGQQLSWPLTSEARLELRGRLLDADQQGAGRLWVQAQGGLEVGQAAVTLSGVEAAAVRAYAAQWLSVPVVGQAYAAAGLAWNQGRVHGQIAEAGFDGLKLGAGRTPETAWQGLRLENAQVDVGQQQVQIARLNWTSPQARLVRDHQGRWMFERWLAPSPVKAPVQSTAKAPAPPAVPWKVYLADFGLQSGEVELLDSSMPGKPLNLRLSDLRLQAQNLSTEKTPVQVQLSAKLAERIGTARWAQPGSLSYQGQVRLEPLSSQGRLQLNRLPLHVLEPYLADALNMRLVRALGGFDGQIQQAQTPAGMTLKAQGNLRLSEVYVQTALPGGGAAAAQHAVEGEDLLRWKELALQKVSLALAPGRAPQVSVGHTALKDFYARVVVLPQGQLNLQQLVREPVVAAEAAEAPAEAAASPVDPLAPRISMGPIELQGGTVKFSDYFIQPNYTADLTGVNGSLGAFASHPQSAEPGLQLAPLQLSAVAQGTASVEISGQLNPLAKPLALDVQAQVKDLDLSPLTPYSIKYAGHGIERGKLSMQVNYQVQPDGQLTATNQLVLNQLTFGDAVEGAPASLPVRLAVALLADSQGVIDLDLPISGSLNDPQFRVAPLVFKILGNIIRKAVTAPFSLLAGAFADDDEKGDIEFAPGRSELSAASQAQLEHIAQALQKKPALKLTLTGQSNPTQELDAWKEARLEQLLAGGAQPEAVEGEEAPEPAGELQKSLPDKAAAARLEALYRSSVKNRPRNLLGLAKDLPAAEMRRLILEQMTVPATAMQDLADARAQRVRSFLLAQKVDTARLFLGAAPVQKSADKPSARVLLNLSVQ